MDQKNNESAENFKKWKRTSGFLKKLPSIVSDFSKVSTFLLKIILFQKIDFLKYLFLEISVIILQYIHLIVLWFIISFSNDSSIMKLIFALFCIFALISFVNAQMQDMQRISIVKIKTVLNCTIAEKVLKNYGDSNLELIKNNSSKAISLDIAVVQKCVFDILSLGTGLIDIIISLTILYWLFGVYSFFAIIVFALLLITSVIIIKKRQIIQQTFRIFTEKRLNVILDTLKSIKLIKMSALEEIFEQKIHNARNNEINELRKDSYLISIQYICRLVAPVLAITGTLSMCIYFHKCVLDSSKILVAISLIYSTSFRLMFLFNDFLDLTHALTAIKVYGDLWGNNLKDEILVKEEAKYGYISMQNSSFAWNNNNNKNKHNTLSNLNITIPGGKLIIVNGNVGSGKSSFLSAINGNMQQKCGNFINTFLNSVYVPQTAWLRKGTWEDNIMFERPLEIDKLNNVINLCALEDEMANREAEITTGVSNVSGGQSARIALARAIYNHNDADLFLLDDTLAALDKRTAKYIFDSVIGPNGILKGKTRIFVTNSYEFLNEADEVYTMIDGRFYENNNNAIENQESINEKPLKASQNENNTFVVEIVEFAEKPSIKKKHKSFYGWNMLNYKMFILLVIFSMGIIFRNFDFQYFAILTSIIIWFFSRMFKTKSIYRRKFKKFLSTFKKIIFFYSPKINKLPTNAHCKNISKNTDNYLLYYLQVFGQWKAIANFLLLFILNAGIDAIFRSIILNSANQKNNKINSILLSVIKIAFIILSQIIYVKGVYNASKLFHIKLTSSILRSPLLYFQNTRLSTIVSVFTNSIAEIDRSVPEALAELSANAVKLAVFFLTILAFYMERSWMLLIFPLLLSAIVIFAVRKCQNYFIHGKLKDIQNEKYQIGYQIMSLLDDIIKGAIVIQSCGVEKNYLQKLFCLYDKNNLYEAKESVCRRNFALIIDLIANFTTFSLLSVFVLMQNNYDDTFKSNLGLILTCSCSFGESLRHFSNQWTRLESGLKSIEILDEFMNLQPECNQQIILQKQISQTTTTTRGEICFDNFSFSYSDSLESLTLNNLNIKINAGEKIGIVGRTGAGKSSFFNVILRIFEGNSKGNIFIDGIPINSLDLKDLRKKIRTIPQEPILITGTLRENIDLHNECSDDHIIKVLKFLNLTKLSKTTKDLLNLQIYSENNNLSLGERQLICLARALLNPKNVDILLVDEGTAAVDQQTDLMVQEAINKFFNHHTILTIAHRFETIKRCDRIIVMQNGEVVEFDTPSNLMNNHKSYFRSLFSNESL